MILTGVPYVATLACFWVKYEIWCNSCSGITFLQLLGEICLLHFWNLILRNVLRAHWSSHWAACLWMCCSRTWKDSCFCQTVCQFSQLKGNSIPRWHLSCSCRSSCNANNSTGFCRERLQSATVLFTVLNLCIPLKSNSSVSSHKGIQCCQKGCN